MTLKISSNLAVGNSLTVAVSSSSNWSDAIHAAQKVSGVSPSRQSARATRTKPNGTCEHEISMSVDTMSTERSIAPGKVASMSSWSVRKIVAKSPNALNRRKPGRREWFSAELTYELPILDRTFCKSSGKPESHEFFIVLVRGLNLNARRLVAAYLRY